MRDRSRTEEEIAFDCAPELAARRHEFRKAKVAELLLEAVDQAKEQVLAIPRKAVPRPAEVRIKELHLRGELLDRQLGDRFVRRQALPDITRKKLFSRHTLFY